MKFDPINKEVFTDEGKFIKKMSCPEKAEWETIEKEY